MDHFKKKN